MSYEFSNKPEYSLITESDYEVILEKAEIKSTETGKRYIEVYFRIRNDVEQAFKGMRVRDTIWADKVNPNQFDNKKLHKILLTQGPEGRYKFADEDEIIQFINGLPMMIHVSQKEADEYHQEAYNEVKYLSYRPSKAQGQTLSPTQNSINALNNAGIEFNVSEDDLPF
jgi:hypothetical protein